MPRYDDDDRDDYDDIRIGRGQARRSGAASSGLGVMSLALAGLVFFAYLFVIAIAAMTADNQNNGPPDKDPVAMLVGLGVIGSVGMNLVGVVLGLVACCQPGSNSICGVLGALFNGLLLIGIGSLICLGIAMGG